MYQEHPIFKLSCPENSKVWRFMDFTKYVAMLEESALWFSRADCLGDPFDSEVPNSVIARMKRNWAEAREEALKAEVPDGLRQAWLRQLEGGPEFHQSTRLWHTVNCW